MRPYGFRIQTLNFSHKKPHENSFLRTTLRCAFAVPKISEIFSKRFHTCGASRGDCDYRHSRGDFVSGFWPRARKCAQNELCQQFAANRPRVFAIFAGLRRSLPAHFVSRDQHFVDDRRAALYEKHANVSLSQRFQRALGRTCFATKLQLLHHESPHERAHGRNARLRQTERGSKSLDGRAALRKRRLENRRPFSSFLLGFRS